MHDTAYHGDRCHGAELPTPPTNGAHTPTIGLPSLHAHVSLAEDLLREGLPGFASFALRRLIRDAKKIAATIGEQQLCEIERQMKGGAVHAS